LRIYCANNSWQKPQALPRSSAQPKATEADTRAASDSCPFATLQTTLAGRNTDWEKLVEDFEVLVAHACGSHRPDAFASDLRKVRDVLTNCLTDTRSALQKQACLCLIALSEALKNEPDLCSDWLIPPLFARTNNGTGIISTSSGLAGLKYVSNACGQKTRKI
jgi:hypothetical protein